MLTQTAAIRLTGLFWLIMSSFLLFKGFSLLSPSLLILGCVVGMLKGYFIMKRTALRISNRILEQSLPLSLKTIYPLSYWFLIALMASLGLFFNLLALPPIIRGVIDTAVGTALLFGAIFYFKIPNLKPSLPEKKNLL
jgi:hypothetical protein